MHSLSGLKNDFSQNSRAGVWIEIWIDFWMQIWIAVSIDLSRANGLICICVKPMSTGRIDNIHSSDGTSSHITQRFPPTEVSMYP